MKNNSIEVSTGTALLLTIGMMLLIGFLINASEPECSMSGCDRDAKEGSRYCYLHDLSYRSYGNPDYNALYDATLSSTTSSSNSGSNSYSGSYSNYNSYDEGYEDVYEDDDYDWDRYWSDSDYADGVDDAMEDADW